MRYFLLTASLLLCFMLVASQEVNFRPIIGIMAQETYGRGEDFGSSYIAASYVKWLESAGARVVPVLTGMSTPYYLKLAHSLNGMLFPGGGVNLTHSDYSAKGQIIYKEAIKLNEKGIYFPIFGTCLGFEALTYFAACNKLVLKSCYAQDMVGSLNITANSSRFFDGLRPEILASLEKQKVIVNYHQWCLTKANYTKSCLYKCFKILSFNQDKAGLEYISTIEFNKYPFYGTAWHPEKMQFEWVLKPQHKKIPHTYKAIEVGQAIANFFINEARKNNQTFGNVTEENDYLIYNYQTTYTGRSGSSFEQEYYFN